MLRKPDSMTPAPNAPSSSPLATTVLPLAWRIHWSIVWVYASSSHRAPFVAKLASTSGEDVKPTYIGPMVLTEIVTGALGMENGSNAVAPGSPYAMPLLESSGSNSEGSSLAMAKRQEIGSEPPEVIHCSPLVGSCGQYPLR